MSTPLSTAAGVDTQPAAVSDADLAPLQIKAAGRSVAYSPLRYPGGKAALAGFFRDVISRRGLTAARYVEPYAGGVGAGIALLRQGVVERLVVNDIDPAVYCFWRAVTECTADLVDLVGSAPLTVEYWREQKALYKAADESNPLELGFAFFYLNRTNRSGILNAGPIGGVNQNGNYKIGARFNRAQLVERLEEIGRLSDRIDVSSIDGQAVVERYAHEPNTFIYIDPPYVDMGGSLYLNAFTHRDHADLAETLSAASEANWVLTYDPSDFIRRLYRQFEVREYELSYSARRTGKASELLIASRRIAAMLSDVDEAPGT